MSESADDAAAARPGKLNEVPPGPAGTRERVAAAAWIGLGTALVLAVFVLLGPILTPFALGGVLAYLLLPGTDWLQRHGLPRAIASVMMVLASAAVALGLVLILLPVVEREAAALNAQLPAIADNLEQRVAPLARQWLGLNVHFDSAALRTLALKQVGQQDALSAVLARFGSGGLTLLGALLTLMLVPVVLFYLLLDGKRLLSRMEEGIPRRWHAQAVQMLGEIDAVLAQFLRGQLTVMLLLAIYYCAALAVAGFDSALPIGLLTGLLIFIPYVGFVLGLALASLVALLQFGTWQAGVSLALVYGFGQVLEGFVLTPRLVGERIGLHPLAVIFALLAFGQLFGFFGILMALPASAALLVALRRVRQVYLASSFYRRT